MKNKFDIPQLFLRLALGLGFLLPVMDRLGWLGEAGVNDNAWGNWANFVAYTNTLMPFMSGADAGVMALAATIAEVVFGIALIIGLQTTIAAIGSSLLTLAFAICMFIFASPGPLSIILFLYAVLVHCYWHAFLTINGALIIFWQRKYVAEVLLTLLRKKEFPEGIKTNL